MVGKGGRDDGGWVAGELVGWVRMVMLLTGVEGSLLLAVLVARAGICSSRQAGRGNVHVAFETTYQARYF